jgi:hypothetical protein
MPFQNATDLWNGTYYSKRANASTLPFAFTHYVYLTIIPSPLDEGFINRTSGFLQAYQSYTISAQPYLGYYFIGWTSSTHPSIFSVDNPLSFWITMPRTIYANFSIGAPTSTTIPPNAIVQVNDQTQMWIWMGLIIEIALLLLGWKLHYLFHVIAIGAGVYYFFYNWQYQIVISNSTGVFLQNVQMYPPNFFYALIAGLMVMHGLFLMTKAVG